MTSMRILHVVLCLLLTLPLLADEALVGRVGAEVPSQVCVYRLDRPSQGLKVGQVVEVRRGQEKLGEAFLVNSRGAVPWLSLKGVYKVQPGDGVFLLGRSSGSAQTALDLSRETPDFCQKNEALPSNGKMYCGPASVSNSLWFLSQNGYPKLSRPSQLELVQELGRAMETDANGTGPAGIMSGLKAILARAGYRAELTYRGWRQKRNRQLKTTRVDREFLNAGVGYSQAVWINLGWYRSDGVNFDRNGGHWVTVVGVRGDGQILTLKVHDPSARNGQSKSTQTVRFEKLDGGQLQGNKKGLPLSAEGFYRVKSGMKISSKATDAIIDGAIVLKLQ